MKNEFLTPKRFATTALILAAILCVFGCSPQPQQVTESSLEREIESLEHPLRLLLEKHLETPDENNDAKIKRKLRSQHVHNRSKNRFDVSWDEYRYKPWGGYFFQTTRQGILHATQENGLWKLESLFHDTPLDEVDTVEENTGIFVRRWNNKTETLEPFDEYVQGRFDPQKPCVVIVHGMNETVDTPWIAIIAERLSNLDVDMNIIAMDWSRFSKSGSDSRLSLITLPMNTAQKIPFVVENTNEYLFGDENLNLAPEKTHLIGFSHGAHIVGLLGTLQSGKVKRITILDPSTSKVHWGTKNRFGEGWSSDSARFIDMYRTSGWAGSGKARGYKVFYVLEKGAPFHSTVGVYQDHVYAPRWFASTIGRDEKNFGYTISTQGPDHGDGTWSGLIISTLPKPATREDIETATSDLVPFPRKGDEIPWSKDTQMYKELLNVTDVVLEKITLDVPEEKKTFSPGEPLNLRIQLSNRFPRNDYFDEGIWGFVKNRKLTGCVYLTDSDDFENEKTFARAIPVSSTGVWGSTQVRFELVREQDTQAQAVVSLRLPKRTIFDEKFHRSRGEFYLFVDIGGSFSETKTFYDLNEDDNYGFIKIQID